MSAQSSSPPPRNRLRCNVCPSVCLSVCLCVCLSVCVPTSGRVRRRASESRCVTLSRSTGSCWLAVSPAAGRMQPVGLPAGPRARHNTKWSTSTESPRVVLRGLRVAASGKPPDQTRAAPCPPVVPPLKLPVLPATTLCTEARCGDRVPSQSSYSARAAPVRCPPSPQGSPRGSLSSSSCSSEPSAMDPLHPLFWVGATCVSVLRRARGP